MANPSYIANAALRWGLAIAVGLAPFAHAWAAEPELVRVAVVNTPQHSGLIDALRADFTQKTGMRVQIYSGNDVYARARAGEADLVISHYGKSDLESFVLDGYGTWPKMVFSNQAVIVGPKSDPADIRGLASASEALRRIAAARAPFVDNALPSMSSLFDLMWESAGRPDKSGWVIDTQESRGRAIRLAEEQQAYVMWGAFPFLRFSQKNGTELEILVSADPLLQRVMAATVVRRDKVQHANEDGADRFLNYLLTPDTQAMIAAFRTPGSNIRLWWPAGRNNSFVGSDD